MKVFLLCNLKNNQLKTNGGYNEFRICKHRHRKCKFAVYAGTGARSRIIEVDAGAGDWLIV